ncbi:MAG: D-alanyl-D-alanine carboxypeptidase family protein [Armatimonadota bacterium]|nr:D-alanyl-D-alanine carboxypeptidase [bacterium]
MRLSVLSRRGAVSAVLLVISVLCGPAVGAGADAGRVIDVPRVKSALPAQPCVNAACAVLMDPQTGVVLYERNAHLHRPMASTTKIMTAILLIENCGMNDIVTASKNASETQFTSIHLKPGEKITVRDLLYGMMIRSANDAAVAAAEHIAGSTAKFAAMMNKKAKEIGCRDTHFVTPNGLYAKGHYSSAYDLCLMARYASKYEIFNEVVNTRRYTLSSRTKNKEDMIVFCRSRFMRDYYGADGIKSGYIKQAGYCYVGSATRNGWRLISAVLRSDNAGRDTAAMMDYAFAGFIPVEVAKKDDVCGRLEVRGGAQDNIALTPIRDFRVIVPKTGGKIVTKIEAEPVEAPIVRGTKMGVMTAYVNGRDAGSVELRAAQNMEISATRKFLRFAGMSGLILACLVVGGKCGAAIAENSRRRRRRFTTSLRGIDRYR